MLETLSRLGIEFDTFTKESKFVVDGSVSELMERLESLEIHGVADNGAHFLDLGQRGLKGKTISSIEGAMAHHYMPPEILHTICGNGLSVMIW